MKTRRPFYPVLSFLFIALTWASLVSLPIGYAQDFSTQFGSKAKRGVSGGEGKGFKQDCNYTLQSGEPHVTAGLGPFFRFEATEPATKRPIASIKELKVMAFNVLNLMEGRGKYARNPTTGKREFVGRNIDKPEWAIQGIADTILRMDPDFVILSEAESLWATSHFNQLKMGGKYFAVLIEGNDERGIDTALLVKADLPFDLEMQSHKAMETTYMVGKTHLFSRDFPVTEVRLMGSDRTKAPLFVLAGTHLKSQRDSDNDPRSVIRRAAQIEGMARVINEEYINKWGDNLPVFFGGDFNADLSLNGVEFGALREAGFTEAFDHLRVDPRDESRITQAFFPRGERGKPAPYPVYSQLDGFFLSPGLVRLNAVKSVEVVPYLDGNGKPKDLVKSLRERNKNPSDHSPVQMVLDTAGLFNPKP